MALSFGKLTILVGAGRMPEVPSFISGAFKIALRQISSDPSSSVSKPVNDSLKEQIESLRQELEIITIKGPIKIASPSGKDLGASNYGVVVIVVVVGFGCVWLKFATRRGLSKKDGRKTEKKEFGTRNGGCTSQ